MRAFLILYMTAPVAAGGLGFADDRASSIYGLYTGSVWAAAILGGAGRRSHPRPVSKRPRRRRRSSRPATSSSPSTCSRRSTSGLALIVIGTGLLKPNVSTLVGSLYAPGDARRDAGFSLFYMGINLGAFLGPLIAGYLAQRVNWHVGFAAAGVGMTLGLVQYVLGRRPAAGSGTGSAPAGRCRAARQVGRPQRLARRRLQAAGGRRWCSSCSPSIFWGAYEQAGSTLNLFADRYTRLSAAGFTLPLVVVPVGAGALRHPAGAGVCVALDGARRSAALDAGQVRLRPGLRRRSRSCC